jgi:ankyrin repeat protein
MLLLTPHFIMAMNQPHNPVTLSNEFYSALLNKNVNKARELIDKKGVSVRESINGNTPLIHAASVTGNQEMMSMLCIRGAGINQTNEDGENALFYASDEATIKFLIDAKINVNQKKYLGRTALMSRVALDSFKNILPLFIAAKADLNIQDEFGDTVAIRAVMFENPSALQALIDAGADLSIRNTQGKTALDIAREIGDSAAIKIIENKNK